jgi:hypothetical protein
MKIELVLNAEASSLVLRTDLEPGSPSGLFVVRQSRGKGWLFYEGVLAPWDVTGLAPDLGVSIAGKWSYGAGTLVCLPWFSKTQEVSRQEFVSSLVHFLGHFLTQRRQLPDFGPFSLLPFLFQNHLGWLVLPRELAAAFKAVGGENGLPRALCHPDFRAEAAWAFAVAGLFLESVTRELPWQAEDEMVEQQELRGLKEKDVRHWLGSEAGDLGTLMKESWSGTGQIVGWQRWLEGESAVRWKRGDWQVLRSELEKKRQLTQRRRSVFWRKHGSLVLGAGLAGLLVLLVGVGVGVQLLRPWPQDFWSPRQVVTGYYRAWENLDEKTLSRLVADDGANKVLALDKVQTSADFVLRQVRTAYEHRSPFETPQVWIAEGRPRLRVGEFVRGLTGLGARELGHGVWKVDYERWISVPDDIPSKNPLPALVLGSRDTDLVKLVKTDRGWKIAEITRTESPLP